MGNSSGPLQWNRHKVQSGDGPWLAGRCRWIISLLVDVPTASVETGISLFIMTGHFHTEVAHGILIFCFPSLIVEPVTAASVAVRQERPRRTRNSPTQRIFFFCFVSFLSFFGMTKKRRRSRGWGNLDRDDKGNSLVSSHANGHIIQVGRLKKRTGVRTVRIGRPHTIVTIVDFWATRRLLLLPL